MYKYIIILITVLLSLNGNAQSDSLYFSVSSYYSNNLLHKTDTIAIKDMKQTLDVHFYKKHFHLFYGLPKQLIKKKYKNQEIVEWSNPENEQANWSDSYTYDTKGRLIEYKYSGCMICSQLPWGYTLTYDENDHMIEQRTYFLSFSHTYEEGEIKTNFKLNEEHKDYTKLTYDTNGSIIALEKYSVHGIEKEIRQLL
ncbi:hypothetical protein GCM10011344_33390 [Dokdonia pacifica]|uniref:YD repeat-containing protein n=1 Tax=Dokdonia pacifica TaxID=1627892 RepID=A0A239BG62_9FLAO|nr:hypothetical protein [Dokdonia pacifica]GGG29805.1 hypothetical protein GCM10011344_33390 [Dokdonia pacifica]SNS06338.1 hypothetical protein SAMN06265376_106118 [Dokdonia pacifica]